MNDYQKGLTHGLLIANEKKTKMEFYSTFRTQFEVLPRLTIIYSKIKEENYSVYKNGFAIEWLWFGVFFNCY